MKQPILNKLESLNQEEAILCMFRVIKYDYRSFISIINDNG